MVKLKQFRIRASSAGKIMGGSFGLSDSQKVALAVLERKDKLTDLQKEKLSDLKYKRANPELPQGAKTYCDGWIKEQVYSRRKEFTSKQTDKGLIVEDNSLDFIAEQLDLGMLFKNEQFFENEFMMGTPDALPSQDDDLVIDAKNSWDCFSFPLLDEKVPNMDYFYQAQVYLHLTGRKHYKLCYVLSDTPFHLIEREAYFYSNNNGLELDDVMADFIKKMTYSDIPDEYKIKTYSFEYDQKVIEELEKRVVACRAYIKEKIKNL